MCFYELHVSMICVLISLWSSKYRVWEPWNNHTYAVLGIVFEVRSMFVDKVNGNMLRRPCSAFMARFYKRYLSSKINGAQIWRPYYKLFEVEVMCFFCRTTWYLSTLESAKKHLATQLKIGIPWFLVLQDECYLTNSFTARHVAYQYLSKKYLEGGPRIQLYMELAQPCSMAECKWVSLELFWPLLIGGMGPLLLTGSEAHLGTTDSTDQLFVSFCRLPPQNSCGSWDLC